VNERVRPYNARWMEREAPMLIHRRLLIAACAVAVLGVACAQGNPTVSGLSLMPVTSPSPTPTATSAPPPSPSPSASPILAEGRSFGIIKSVDAANSELVFDLEQFFSGDAADKAAQEDGVIGPGEHVDNDVYIRNVNTKLRIVPISSDVDIVLIKWSNCCDHTFSPTLARFAQAFPGPDPNEDFRGPASPYWLTVKDGVIVKVEEQYLP
jgi:hypothetical protein